MNSPHQRDENSAHDRELNFPPPYDEVNDSHIEQPDFPPPKPIFTQQRDELQKEIANILPYEQQSNGDYSIKPGWTLLTENDIEVHFTQPVLALIKSQINSAVLEARAEDSERFYKLNQIAKRYNIVGFVKLYNEAIKRDWQDIRVPITRDLTMYDPDEFSQLQQSKQEKST